MPKTLIAWNTFEDAVKFYELEGDYRHLDDVIINTCAPGTEAFDWDSPECKKLQAEYEKRGEELSNLLMLDGRERPHLKEPTKDWDYFIQCGFAP